MKAQLVVVNTDGLSGDKEMYLKQYRYWMGHAWMAAQEAKAASDRTKRRYLSNAQSYLNEANIYLDQAKQVIPSWEGRITVREEMEIEE